MVFHIYWNRLRKTLSVWNQLSKHELPELSRPGVIIKDRVRVDHLLDALQKTGVNSLQIVTDFDMTLSKFAHNGQRCPTTHNMLHNSCLISEDCKRKMQALQERFYPVEIDAELSLEDKVPLMVEWWSAAHQLLVDQKIQKQFLSKAVSQSGAKLRDGYVEFFGLLRKWDVPVWILSAGLGDILEEVLKHKRVFSPNISVRANYMHFTEEGWLQGFKEPLIHSFNKVGGHIGDPSHNIQSKDRPNVLLLGDSLGDVTMADNITNVSNILRIGFLNDKVEERREVYTSSYDIILERDETLDIPNAILRYISMEINV